MRGGGGGNKFHQIKNNNPYVKIKFSILPNLFLFNPTFKCMQVLVKAKTLNTFIYITHLICISSYQKSKSSYKLKVNGEKTLRCRH